MIARVLVLGILTMGAATAFASCTPDATQIPENVIVIPEDYDGQFNAESGDTLVLVMYQDDNGVPTDWIGRCNDYGGEPILNTRTNIATCEDVDF